MYRLSILPISNSSLLKDYAGLSQSPTAASFVRPTRPADQPQSFIGALNEKYAGDGVQHPDSQIVISGKVAQEMGFDKIWRKLGQAAELKVVILDGLRMASATLPGEATIRETCPKIVQLDMSRNLFQTLEPVVRICGELPVLRTLAIKLALPLCLRLGPHVANVTTVEIDF